MYIWMSQSLVGRLIHHELDKYFKTSPNLKKGFHLRDPSTGKLTGKCFWQPQRFPTLNVGHALSVVADIILTKGDLDSVILPLSAKS